ncbi:hypothetical protein H9636_14540 [Ureibacillus sp. Re31]|uniref:Uncharacterized protein n=1 Tax=Ureibacillus galli TaxID=2762222 RepID=A0ABR8XF64_9BACL|nr:hypothetical protein [Ureibacillus galli]MBD8027868.1 hypothetical protein [Ureibacillus galli]
MKGETRQEKFRRIATKRMSRIFSNMNLIANLSNKKNYMYCQQEVDELFQAYHDKGKEIRAYFESQSTSQPLKEPCFKFAENMERDTSKETKEEKFKRVAENRINKVFSDMNLIANLSNRKHYTYSVQEVEELFQAYHDKGKEVRAYFEPLKEEFTFSN